MNDRGVVVRGEDPGDGPADHRVNALAFERPNEARPVDALRETARPYYYYPRFGFVPAVTKGLRCEYPVSDEAFMVAELLPAALAGRTGLVKYLPEFAGV